jgi:hypothetical protein
MYVYHWNGDFPSGAIIFRGFLNRPGIRIVLLDIR